MPEPVTTGAPDKSQSYLTLTRTATYGFLSALPLIALYEVMIIMANQGRVSEIRVSSEVWLKQLFQGIDGPAFLILGGIVALVGVGIIIYERKKNIPIRPRFFLGMILESSFYAVVIALIVSQIVWSLTMYAQSAPNIVQGAHELWMQLALSIGAGIYEELLFRVILVGGMYALLRTFLIFKTPAYIIAAIVGALLFSAVHYIGALGDDFTLPSFAFRFLFGLALNILYLTRGFGVAAWTHALYDVMVVTRVLG